MQGQVSCAPFRCQRCFKVQVLGPEQTESCFAAFILILKLRSDSNPVARGSQATLDCNDSLGYLAR
jgi:hypothetical protein